MPNCQFASTNIIQINTASSIMVGQRHSVLHRTTADTIGNLSNLFPAPRRNCIINYSTALAMLSSSNCRQTTVLVAEFPLATVRTSKSILNGYILDRDLTSGKAVTFNGICISLPELTIMLIDNFPIYNSATSGFDLSCQWTFFPQEILCKKQLSKLLW